MDSCKIQLTEAALRHGNLNIRCCGKDFFPQNVFGASSKKRGLGVPITLHVEGLPNPIESDIPTDNRTCKPKWIFRKRRWVKDFVKFHKLRSGDSITIFRTDKSTYKVTPNNHNQQVFQKEYSTRKTKNKKKLIAFGWYGGKFSHLDWLLPLLPRTKHFCDVFGGSAAVLLNREPSPIETYNDIDREVVNFFRVLRDQSDELIRLIGLTPFSKEEFKLAISDQEGPISSLERARRFFVRARQVRTGLAQKASAGRWAHCRLTSRAKMAGAVSRWLGSIEDLPYIAQRLIRVQIENSPAIKVIKRYDSKETLFYCDPPYPHESRGDSNAYAHEMTDNEHRELARLLHTVKGKVALSSYHCDIMDELYGDWIYIEAPIKNCHSVKTPRREVLWVNYDIGKDTRCRNRSKFSTQLFSEHPAI
jgi:DNA adenine methylase